MEGRGILPIEVSFPLILFRHLQPWSKCGELLISRPTDRTVSIRFMECRGEMVIVGPSKLPFSDTQPYILLFPNLAFPHPGLEVLSLVKTIPSLN